MDETKERETVSAVEEESLFSWKSRIKMLFNPILWRSFLFVFGISILLLGIFFVVISGNFRNTLLLMGGLFVFFAVIWAVVGVVFDLAGGFHASYVITSRGIYFSSGKAEKDIADAVAVIGILSGSAGRAGAGLLARSEQDAFIGWSEVRKVKVSEGKRYILVKKGFGSKPVGLYCTEDNFGPVLQTIRSKSPSAHFN